MSFEQAGSTRGYGCEVLEQESAGDRGGRGREVGTNTGPRMGFGNSW